MLFRRRRLERLQFVRGSHDRRQVLDSRRRDQVRTVGPNTAIYYTPNVQHGLRNVGTTDMRYLVVREC